MNATITTRYVNIAWGTFLCIAFGGEAALCSCEVRASCNVLRERWHIKTYRSVARGTSQKTEDFEERENWVLVCGENFRFLN